MRLPLCLAFLMIVSFPARGDNVPFAVPSSSRLGTPSETYYASLSDIMILNQLRHIKLWHAGATGNWALATFEVTQLKDTFAKAAMFYDKIPIDQVLSINGPLDAIRRAATKKDPAAFATGFAALTTACNGCHQTAKVGFIVIAVPTASPFSDEKY